MKFTDWINAKLEEWSKEQLRKMDTVELFAKYIGVSQQLMSFWLNGKRTPGARSLSLLRKRYGSELDSISDVRTEALYSPLDSLPPGIKNLLNSSLEEINAMYAKTGVHPDSPEAVSIAEEILSKYGFTINSVEHVDDV